MIIIRKNNVNNWLVINITLGYSNNSDIYGCCRNWVIILYK